jgi:hypothetical protein
MKNQYWLYRFISYSNIQINNILFCKPLINNSTSKWIHVRIKIHTDSRFVEPYVSTNYPILGRLNYIYTIFLETRYRAITRTHAQ